MAGLPCEACQEETIVIPSAQIVEDAGGRVVYRRYRACTNPDCELYLVRRETLEVFAPLRPDAAVLPPYNHNVKTAVKRRLPHRTAPFPIDLVPEEIRRAYESLSSITDDDAAVLELARHLGRIHAGDVRAKLSFSTHLARKSLNRLKDLGLLTKSAVYRCFEPVPGDRIPPHVRLPEHLQRSVS